MSKQIKSVGGPTPSKISVERLERALRLCRTRPQVGSMLGITPHAVGRLVARYGLQAQAQWIKGDEA